MATEAYVPNFATKRAMVQQHQLPHFQNRMKINVSFFAICICSYLKKMLRSLPKLLCVLSPSGFGSGFIYPLLQPFEIMGCWFSIKSRRRSINHLLGILPFFYANAFSLDHLGRQRQSAVFGKVFQHNDLVGLNWKNRYFGFSQS